MTAGTYMKLCLCVFAWIRVHTKESVIKQAVVRFTMVIISSGQKPTLQRWKLYQLMCFLLSRRFASVAGFPPRAARTISDSLASCSGGSRTCHGGWLGQWSDGQTNCYPLEGNCNSAFWEWLHPEFHSPAWVCLVEDLVADHEEECPAKISIRHLKKKGALQEGCRFLKL